MRDDAIAVPNPVVIVEVLSSSTQIIDAGGKLADSFRLPSVQHYLPLKREIIHHSSLPAPDDRTHAKS
jgi:hypothetical protein